VKQLEAIGLKWVIHARNKTNEDDDDDDDDFVGGEFIESISMERSNVVLLSNGNDPAQRNTSSNDIPPLLPTSSAFVDNSHQSLGSTK
jgi:hypothetical protein